MRLTMPSSAMPGAKIESSWRLLGDSTLTVSRRADLDVYMRRSRALINTDDHARRDGGICERTHHAMQLSTSSPLPNFDQNEPSLFCTQYLQSSTDSHHYSLIDPSLITE